MAEEARNMRDASATHKGDQTLNGNRAGGEEPNNARVDDAEGGDDGNDLDEE